LQQPISVYSPNIETLELVVGLHRLEAARKLGWEDIDCVFVNMDDLDRQLWEIDENLMRAELGPAEMAEHTAKRADLVRKKVEFLKLRKTDSGQSQNAQRGQGDFDEETAKSTGKSKSTVRRDKARGEAIPADVLGKIRGTELDKGTYLDKLKTLSRDEMREKVGRDLEAIKEGNFGNTKDAREVLPKAEGNLGESAVAEKLDSITEIDFSSAIETVSEAEDVDLPLGFGRD
jgi:hypothetical protein